MLRLSTEFSHIVTQKRRLRTFTRSAKTTYCAEGLMALKKGE